MWACLRPVGTSQFAWLLVLAVLAAFFQSPSEARAQRRHQFDGAIGAHQRDYLPATLSREDYPGRMAYGTVMVACNWPKGSDGYRRVADFFSDFAELTKPPRHPAGRKVNLAVDLPSCNFRVVADAQADFNSFLAQPGILSAAQPEDQRRAVAQVFEVERRASARADYRPKFRGLAAQGAALGSTAGSRRRA
jgi:hypothetical protein